MEILAPLKLLFQLTCLVIFIYQMHSSIRRYIQKPVVTEVSSKSADQFKGLIVYICQEGQFNFTSSKMTGYVHHYRFLAGWNDKSEDPTWKGVDGNTSFARLFNELYTFDYSSVHGMQKLDGKMKAVKAEKDFILPNGFCVTMNLAHKFTSLRITSAVNVKIILVHPNMDMKFQVVENPESQIAIGSSRNNFYTLESYRVNYYAHNNLIHDGKTCTDYDKIGSSYGDCVRSAVENQMMQWYGCIPPWYSIKTTNKCKDNESYNHFPGFSDNINDEYVNLMRTEPLDCMKDCLPPCRFVNFKVVRKTFRNNKPGSAFLSLYSNKEVKVFTKVYNYDAFQLVVDLGSSLGLWLGLSALSMLDYIIIIYAYIRNVRRLKFWDVNV